MRQVLANPFGGFNKIDGVMVVIVNAGCDGKHVWIKNIVFGRKSDFFDQQVLGARTNQFVTLKGIGLTFLVKGHHHSGSTVQAAQASLF